MVNDLSNLVGPEDVARYVRSLSVTRVNPETAPGFYNNLRRFFVNEGDRYFLWRRNGYDEHNRIWEPNKDNEGEVVLEEIDFHPETPTDYPSVNLEFDVLGMDIAITPNRILVDYNLSGNVLYVRLNDVRRLQQLPEHDFGQEDVYIKL